MFRGETQTVFKIQISTEKQNCQLAPFKDKTLTISLVLKAGKSFKSSLKDENEL